MKVTKRSWIKKLLASLVPLTCVPVVVTATAISVSAADVSQDGIVASLNVSSDELTDSINAELMLKNTNSFDIESINIDSFCPNGYSVCGNPITAVDVLKSGEPLTLNFEYKKVEISETTQTTSNVSNSTPSTTTATITTTVKPDKISSSPPTGDNFPVAILSTILLSSGITAALCIKKKKGKKFLSLLIVGTICGTFVAELKEIPSSAAIEVHSFTIEETVDGNPDNISIKIAVSYNYLSENINDTIPSTLASLEDLLGTDIDTTDANDNGIPDSIEAKLEIDSDSDGLPDVFEILYNTDPNNPDTDGDLLPDGYEVMTLGTNPLEPDSDFNGINDTDEDFDKDNLSSIEEYRLGTNPFKTDSDNDGLSDSDEINLYGTDPTNVDSDSDGLNDGTELKYSMIPTNPDTLGDGILDGDRKFNVSLSGEVSDNQNISVTVETILSGTQIDTFKVDKVDNSDVFMNDTIPGYVGNAYDLNVENGIDSAKLSFTLDDSLFNDPEFDPAIFYWDAENEILIELDNQKVDGNIISAELSHFSEYIVLDKSKYYSTVYEYEIQAPVAEELQNKQFDVILTLDESGSIEYYDFDIMKKRCVELIDSLDDNDNIGIVTFDDEIRHIQSLTDKSTAKSVVENLLQHEGNTALYDAVSESVSDFKVSTESTRIIIALTDGQDNESSISNVEAAEIAKNDDVIVYSIGVGYDIDTEALIEMAELTGGQYYHVSDFSELEGIFNRVITDADLYKDSDGDGISDYHEKCIANGQLKLGSGAVVPNFSSLNYLSDDSDSDNLLDSDEIEIRERIVGEKTVYYCYMYSNPCLVDSDNDGLSDEVEIYAGFNPLSFGGLTYTSSNPQLPVNNFNDWMQLLADENAWNTIHIAVQNDIKQRYFPNIATEYTLRNSSNKAVKRIDLYNSLLSQIWEVKPASYQTSPNREKGLMQLDGYIELAKQPQNGPLILTRGGSSIANGTCSVGNYKVEYKNMQNGLITYHFKRTVPVAPPVVVEAPEYENEKHPETRTAWYEWLWEGAKSVGYSVAAFGEWVLDGISYLGDAVVAHAEEIIAVGIEIGGILGIMYIIANLLPIVVFA